MNFQIDWNISLKIWAVVGPLIAAAVSALWSRRMQVKDREYEWSRLSQARLEALEDRKAEFSREASHTHKTELRAAISNFIADCNEFAISCIDFGSNSEDPEIIRELNSCRSSMNKSFHSVSILGNDDIARSATKLLNLAADTPIAGEDLQRKLEAHNKEYLTAKSDLGDLARKLLGFRDEV